MENLTVMIGAYIITRMTSFLTRTGERTESAIVHYLAIGTIFVTVVVILQVMTSFLFGLQRLVR